MKGFGFRGLGLQVLGTQFVSIVLLYFFEPFGLLLFRSLGLRVGILDLPLPLWTHGSRWPFALGAGEDYLGKVWLGTL